MNNNNELEFPLYDKLTRIDQDLFNTEISWQLPDFIKNNMVHTFRFYQEDALRYFHYSQTLDTFKYDDINHVLFNMATGSGKTDLMAGLILYLYERHNYQNFLFLVNTKGVLNKTIDNLINKTSDKYLFTNNIEINGERIIIMKVDKFPQNPNPNTIYIKLTTVQSIKSDLFTVKENITTINDFKDNKVVILGDEAHHYSASTKSLRGEKKEKEKSWEKTIKMILDARNDNKLLEFTATVATSDKFIYEKYKDKIIYRYALDKFIFDGYSKNVRRIQTSNTDEINMMNAVLLSEYRRIFAREKHGISIKPVILFKSQLVNDSITSNKLFDDMINNLTLDSLTEFLHFQSKISNEETSETFYHMYQYYLSNFEHLETIVENIKREFSFRRVINANDSSRSGILETGSYEALNTLESPSNLYRVVFAVAKLTEGWDVLNLYDIVRLSDSPNTRNTETVAEAQLIGRGARYNPFIMNGERLYQRRFKDDTLDNILLETVHYHTINNPDYIKLLLKELENMNLPTGEDKSNPLLEIKLKKSFKSSNIWKTGKIYYNKNERISDENYKSFKDYGISNSSDIRIEYDVGVLETFYNKELEVREEKIEIPLKIDKRYLYKVFSALTFYHFNNLKKYIPMLTSMEEFFGENWLNIKNRTFYVIVNPSIDENYFTPERKFEILKKYFNNLSISIKRGFTKTRGTNEFIGYPIRDYVIDYQARVPLIDSSHKFLSQLVNRYEFKNKHFSYESAIVNQTEKQFIDRMLERMNELTKKYDEAYLIRMDENMHSDSLKGNKLKLYDFRNNTEGVILSAFQPDFILLLSNANYYIQIFIEPKGLKLHEDQWKENLLLYLNDYQDDIIFDEEVEGLKVKGVRFYTKNDERKTINQIGEISLGHSFESLSFLESDEKI